MTNAEDRNDDLVTAREKLEWVPPQIVLMGANATERKPAYWGTEHTTQIGGTFYSDNGFGPS